MLRKLNIIIKKNNFKIVQNIISMYFSISNKIKVLLELGRYNYPTGAFLLMWPCFWGVLYQPNFDQDLLKFLGLFIIGSFVMRGVGCTINDFLTKS